MARIVIVDDDEIVAEVATDVLESGGHMVSVVHHGDDAVAAVLASEPDLLILDYALPGMSGMEILRAVRKLPQFARMPVMMLTARAGKLHILHADQEGADHYVVKPFAPLSLLKHCESLLLGSKIANNALRAATMGSKTETSNVDRL
jgi:DNA-binding response OmpR family regulator